MTGTIVDGDPARTESVSGAPYSPGQGVELSTVSFPHFNHLPPEIRSMIWDYAMPEDVSEVHILKPHLVRLNMTIPTVNTCFPTIAHICKEARQHAFNRVNLYPSAEAGLAIPFRDFRPDLDVLFIGAFHFFAFFSRPDSFWGGLVHKLQHIAVDIVLTSTHDRLPNTFRFLDNLKTLTIVFGEARGTHKAGQILQLGPTIPRCRLRPFTEEELHLTRTRDPDPRTRVSRPVSAFLEMLHKSLEDRTKEFLLGWSEIGVSVGVWDYDQHKLNLQITAQVFVEFQRRPSGPCWIENGTRSMRGII